jgi:hypothetical protein
MRKSGFSEEQMVEILREADRTSVGAAAKKNKSASRPSTFGASTSPGSSRATCASSEAWKPRTRSSRSSSLSATSRSMQCASSSAESNGMVAHNVRANPLPRRPK